jgi:hypothetical protein
MGTMDWGIAGLLGGAPFGYWRSSQPPRVIALAGHARLERRCPLRGSKRAGARPHNVSAPLAQARPLCSVCAQGAVAPPRRPSSPPQVPPASSRQI